MSLSTDDPVIPHVSMINSREGSQTQVNSLVDAP
jgi:hypothetical protein